MLFKNFRNLEYPLGALPVLKLDGGVFCQTKAIQRYALKLAGINAKNDIDQLKIDMICASIDELMEKGFMGAFMETMEKFPPGKEHPFKLAGIYYIKINKCITFVFA